MLESKREVRYWLNIFERVYQGEIDTWDYQWFFANWFEGRVAAFPSVNLISNIGYRDDATHTISEDSPLANRPLAQMPFPLSHPAAISRDVQAAHFTVSIFFSLTFI